MPTFPVRFFQILFVPKLWHFQKITDKERRVKNSWFWLSDSRLHVARQLHPHEDEAADKAHCHGPESNKLEKIILALLVLHYSWFCTCSIMRFILGVLGLCVWSSTFESKRKWKKCAADKIASITMRPAPPRENMKLLASPWDKVSSIWIFE